MSINKQLEKLYIDYYENALTKYKSVDFKMANPLLLKVDEEKYYKSDLKVMILGQETWGWFDRTTSPEDIKILEDNHWESIDEFDKSENTKEFGSVTVEQLMYEYDKYLKHDIRGKKRSTFWNNGINWFAKKLETHYQDKKLYFIWNNVSKLGGIDETGVASQIKDFEHKHFHLLKNEVEILKPDIVIFLTGPNRDADIKANFENVTFDLCGCTQFVFSGKNKYKIPSKIISTDLPNRTIRLYHPNCFGGYNRTKEIAFEMLIDSKNLPLLCDKTNIKKLFSEELPPLLNQKLQELKLSEWDVSFGGDKDKISEKYKVHIKFTKSNDWKIVYWLRFEKDNMEKMYWAIAKLDDKINSEDLRKTYPDFETIKQNLGAKVTSTSFLWKYSSYNMSEHINILNESYEEYIENIISEFKKVIDKVDLELLNEMVLKV